MHKNGYAGDASMHLQVHLNHDFWNADFVEVKLKDSLYSKRTKNSTCSLQTEKQVQGLEKPTQVTRSWIKHKSAKIQRTAALETKLK